MKIRSIAICRIEHEGKLFLFEGYDPKKKETFYRPLGGGIEFGELAKDAVVREMREEMGTEIAVTGNAEVFENFYEFNGQPGHEIVFVLPAEFTDKSFYEDRVFTGSEGGAAFSAVWVPVSEFIEGKRILYPAGLVESLTEAYPQLIKPTPK